MKRLTKLWKLEVNVLGVILRGLVLLFVFTADRSWAQKSAEATPTIAPGPTPTFNQGLQFLEEGRSTLEESVLSQAREAFEPCANTVNGQVDCYYQLARTYLYLFRRYDLDKKRDMAQKAVENGIRFGKEAVLLDGKSAEHHSLLALLYEAQLTHGDFFTGISIGPKVGDENKKALALDPALPQAQLALGIQYVMAPPIGGGDVKKGIATLRKALELDPRLDEAYFWMAKGYRKQNDRLNFKKALESALELSPQNAMALKELDDWK